MGKNWVCNIPLLSFIILLRVFKIYNYVHSFIPDIGKLGLFSVSLCVSLTSLSLCVSLTSLSL